MASLEDALRNVGQSIQSGTADVDAALRNIQTIRGMEDKRIQAKRLFGPPAASMQPTPEEDFTTEEIERATEIESALGSIGSFDKQSLLNTDPQLFGHLFRAARSEEETTAEAKFRKTFPDADLRRVKTSQGSEWVYRMQPGEPYKLIPRLSAPALASHLLREDVGLSVAGAGAGALAGGAVAGIPGALVGGVVGAGTGDAAGQLMRQFVEEMAGFPEEYKVDPIQVLFAAGGQALGESIRVARPLLRKKAAQSLLDSLEAAPESMNQELVRDAVEFALKSSLPAPVYGQISENPTVRALWRQAVAVTKRGEGITISMQEGALAKLRELAGQGDEAADAAIKSLSGEEFQDLITRVKTDAGDVSQFPQIPAGLGGLNVQQGIRQGAARMQGAYKAKLDIADKLMRGEKQPFFNINEAKLAAQNTTEAKAVRMEDGGEMAIKELSPEAQQFVKELFETMPEVRTFKNKEGGVTTAIEQMRYWRERAFSLAQEDQRFWPVYNAIVDTMNKPQNIGSVTVAKRPRTAAEKAAQANVVGEGELRTFGEGFDEAIGTAGGPSTPIRITEHADVGYKNYFEGIKQLKEYEMLVSQPHIKRALREGDPGNLAWANFAPGKGQTWDDLGRLLTPTQMAIAQDSIISQLIRMRPAEAARKLDSFAVASEQGTLDKIIPPETQKALRNWIDKMTSPAYRKLEQQMEGALTPYENMFKLAETDNPAVLDVFLAQASPKQKDGLKYQVFRSILSDASAAPGMGRPLIDTKALNDTVAKITQDRDRYLRFMSEADIEWLEGLNKYASIITQGADMQASLLRGELAKTFNPFRWLVAPITQAYGAFQYKSLDQVAVILGKPSWRQGMANLDNTLFRGMAGAGKEQLERWAAEDVARGLNVMGALFGVSAAELAKIGEFK